MLYYVHDVQLFLQPQGGPHTEPRCDSYPYLVHIHTYSKLNSFFDTSMDLTDNWSLVHTTGVTPSHLGYFV